MSLTQWIAHNQITTGFVMGGLWMILLLKLVEQTKASQKQFTGTLNDQTRSDKRIRMTLK